jgi:type I restriction enzyme S subunit
MINTQDCYKKNLGDIVGISKGKKHIIINSYSKGEYKRYIQIDDLRNDNALKYTNDDNGIDVKFEDIIIAWDGANAGTIGFNLEGLIGSTLARLRIKDKNIFSGYLGWFLRNQSKYLRANCTGATIPHINKSILESIKVPLLSYSIQKQIAELLEKTNQAKQRRLEANKLTEQFLQSAFIEMFGDPVRNPKGWELKKMGEVFHNIRYGTGSPPIYIETGIPFIRATNIKNNAIEEKQLVFISEAEAYKIIKCKLKEGDLIIVRSGINTGDAVVITRKYDGAYAGYDLIIELNKENAIFYSFLINSSYGKTIIKPLSRRAGQPHLNAEQIKELELYFPPQALQKRFAELFQKVEELKEIQKNSELELDNLFNSLIQKAFEGDLF